jgi:hypothetical protein
LLPYNKTAVSLPLCLFPRRCTSPITAHVLMGFGIVKRSSFVSSGYVLWCVLFHYWQHIFVPFFSTFYVHKRTFTIVNNTIVSLPKPLQYAINSIPVFSALSSTSSWNAGPSKVILMAYQNN